MLGKIALTLVCLLGVGDAASGVPLRFHVLVAGAKGVDTQTSTVAGVSASVSGSGVPYLYGTVDWNVFASTANGALRASVDLNSIGTSPGNVAPVVGGIATAVIDDTLYITRGSGYVTMSFTLELTGACVGSSGTNSDGSAKSTCAVRAAVSAGGNLLFELTDPGSFTKGFAVNVPGGFGDYALPISYSLDVEASATGGFASGDFSHTARLSISAPFPVRTESGFSYAPVPEPAATTFCAAGSVVFVVVRRRWANRANPRADKRERCDA